MKNRTVFGELVQRYRLKHFRTLAVTAKAVGVSVSMLSAVETGRKDPPKKLVEALATHFELNDEMKAEFEQAALESSSSVSLSLKDASEPHRETAAAFARNFSCLSGEQLEKIQKILDKQ